MRLRSSSSVSFQRRSGAPVTYQFEPLSARSIPYRLSAVHTTWAVREIADWATVYPVLGRPELTPEMARQRIRGFAEAALARGDDSS